MFQNMKMFQENLYIYEDSFKDILVFLSEYLTN